MAVVIAAVVTAAAGALIAGIAATPRVARDSTLILRLRGELAETEPLAVLGSVLPVAPTVRSVVDAIARAKTDPRISALLVVPADLPALWGKVQEVREAIADFRKSGKPAIALLEHASDREYYLATACDRIFLVPTSTLDLRGVSSADLFLRGTFEKLGLSADFVHIGDYKTAPNAFTERGFTPAHREMAESLARDTYDQLVETIARARRKPVHAIQAVVDQGPFLADEALRLGLVDGLAYEDQIDDRVRLGAAGLRGVDLNEYEGVPLPTFHLRRRPRIALVHAAGTIDLGESGMGPDGTVVGADTLVSAIRAARADETIKAIVLRIDSPGGSSIASDVIWRELMLTRGRKPLVVSMSDLAASGGYYIALPAHTIVAQPGTLTGSIGVFGGKFVIRGALDKLGARAESVDMGKHAGMQSPLRPYTDDERTLYERQLEVFYRQFVQKVADARHSTVERVDGIAQGRVWTGRQALALGLVDELGGLGRAIAIARGRAHLAADAPVDVVEMPDRRSLYELVGRTWGATGTPLPFAEAWGIDGRTAQRVAGRVRLFQRGEPLALMPFIW